MKHPFFANAIYFWEDNQKLHFDFKDIDKILKTYDSMLNLAENTFLFYNNSFVDLKGNISNKIQIREISEFLAVMKAKVSAYYMQSYYDYAKALVDKLREKGIDVKTFEEELDQLDNEQKSIKEEADLLKNKLESLKEKRKELIQKLTQKLNEKSL